MGATGFAGGYPIGPAAALYYDADVAEIDVPKGVRIASALVALMAPAGLFLLVAGILDLSWWSTAGAARLLEVFTQIRIEHGAQAPALLRRGGAAVELVVIGAACLAYGMLAPMIIKGRRWARTWGLVLGLATFVVGLVGIGADATQPTDLRTYLDLLTNAAAGEQIPQIKALIYPGWQLWIEDLAQGLQVLVSLAAAVALVGAGVFDPHHFAAKQGPETAPDAWDAAISRIRQENAQRQDRGGE